MTNRESWKKFAKRQAAWEKKYQKRFLAVIRKNNKAFLDKLVNLDQAKVLVDMTILPISYRQTMIDLYKQASIPQAKDVYNETRAKAYKFTGMGRDELWIADVIHYLETNGLDQLTQSIADTQKKIIIKIIQKGIDEGLSYDQIVKEISTNPVWVSNAMRIARTESARAMNYGHMVGAAALNFMSDKVWISAMDRRTRGADGKDHYDHYHMNEQRVGYNDPFNDPKANVKLMFPGDPNAPAGATINCRCRVIFEPVRSDGKLIPKQPSLPQLTTLI